MLRLLRDRLDRETRSISEPCRVNNAALGRRIELRCLRPARSTPAFQFGGMRSASHITWRGPLFQASGKVAVDSTGRFVVVWNSSNQDGSETGLYSQRFSMIVPLELMQFRVE
jgi:hypothetical protein